MYLCNYVVPVIPNGGYAENDCHQMYIKLELLLLLIAGNGPLMREMGSIHTHTHTYVGNWVSGCQGKLGIHPLLLSLYVPIQPHEPYLVAGWLSLQGKRKRGKKRL
jgi:hypothetical protein